MEYARKHIDINGYVLKKSITADDNNGTFLDLTFVKILNGYETYDRFYVQIGYDGQIKKFTKKDYGLFDGIVVPKIDNDLLKKTASEYVQKKLGKSVDYNINDEETVVYLDENKIPFISLEIQIEKKWRADAVESGVDDRYWQRMNIPVYCEDVKALN